MYIHLIPIDLVDIKSILP